MRRRAERFVVALSLAVTGIGSSQTADSPVQLKEVSSAELRRELPTVTPAATPIRGPRL